MSKEKYVSYRDEYLIVRCKELLDGWECDCERIPIAIVKNYTPYLKKGFEIYAIREKDGDLFCIKEYDEKTLVKA